MEAADTFGVVVRTLGLLILLYGSWCAVYGLNALLGLANTKTPNEWKDYLPTGAVLALIGFALLAGAKAVVEFAY